MTNKDVSFVPVVGAVGNKLMVDVGNGEFADAFYLKNTIAGERVLVDMLATREEWIETVVTGTLGDTVVSALPSIIRSVRTGGLAATVGAIQVKDGAIVKDDFIASTPLATQRDMFYTRCDTNITVNLANASDKLLVFWQVL